MVDPTEFFKRENEKHMVSTEAVVTMLRLEGYGEDGTDALMKRIQLIAEMAPTEIIKKVSELRLYTGEPNNSDVGKMVAIRERTISGVLTDILDLNKNNNFCIAIDGKIYKMDAWDLIIVDEPSRYMDAEPEVEPVPQGMDLVHSLVQVAECVYVNLVTGIAFCSHMTYEDSMDDVIPSLRLWQDRLEALRFEPKDPARDAFVERILAQDVAPKTDGPVLREPWIKQIEIIHTSPSRCVHVEFKNGGHVCSENRHTALGSIDPPSLRED